MKMNELNDLITKLEATICRMKEIKELAKVRHVRVDKVTVPYNVVDEDCDYYGYEPGCCMSSVLDTLGSLLTDD